MGSAYCKYCKLNHFIWVKEGNGKWYLCNPNRTRHKCQSHPFGEYMGKRRAPAIMINPKAEKLSYLVKKKIKLKNGIEGVVEWDDKTYNEQLQVIGMTEYGFIGQVFHPLDDIDLIEKIYE